MNDKTIKNRLGTFQVGQPRFMHVRQAEKDMPSMTICTVRPGDAKHVHVGVALCLPGDNFSKQKGRNIARGQAIRSLSRSLSSKDHAPTWRSFAANIDDDDPAKTMAQIIDRIKQNFVSKRLSSLSLQQQLKLGTMLARHMQRLMDRSKKPPKTAE